MKRKRKRPNYDQWVIDFIIDKCQYTTEHAVSYLLGIAEEDVVAISEENNCRKKYNNVKVPFINVIMDQIITADIITSNGYVKSDDLGYTFVSYAPTGCIDLLEWKYFKLGTLVLGKRIFDSNTDNRKFESRVCVQSNRTDLLSYYYNINLEKLITNLNYDGLLLILASNSINISRRTKLGNIEIRLENFDRCKEEYKQCLYKLLSIKYNSIGLVNEVKTTHNKTYICFDNSYNKMILDILKVYIPIRTIDCKYEYIIEKINQYPTKNKVIIKY